MSLTLLIQQLLPFVLILVLGFPLVMLLLGEFINWLETRNLPLVAPVRILRNWIVPSTALWILLTQVLTLPRDNSSIKIVETLFWITVIYGALTLMNVVLFEDAPKESWQAKVPQLLRDLARLFLVVLGGSIVLSSVWGANLAGLLTALGFGSLVLGLALQDSLGNIFSGISLLFEQPFSVGDWIKVGDYQGKVVAINWRSVHLLNIDDFIQIVPNSILAKQTFINYSRPTNSLHVTPMEIGFSYDDPPNQVIKLLREAASNIEGISPRKQPKVTVTRYADSSIIYKIQVYTETVPLSRPVLDELKARIWYVARRNHLTIPYPIYSLARHHPASDSPESNHQQIVSAVHHTSSFASLTPQLLEKVLKASEIKDYAKQEMVLYQGEALSGLYLILQGAVRLSAINLNEQRVTIGELFAGEFFGEKASLLSDRISDVSVQVLEDLRVLLVDIETLQFILAQSPRLAHELGEVMELRRRTIQSLCRVS
ncbi:MAG: mechanosensitive ion channel family protein [Snowella sp.]|nr:mechanosensitive ion channel family protein [Snowella sp.]